MLECYIESAVTIRHLRSGPAAPYLDGFADWLATLVYQKSTILAYLCCLAKYSDWMQDNGLKCDQSSSPLLEQFRAELDHSGVLRYTSVMLNKTFNSASLFMRFLEQLGVVKSPQPSPTISEKYPLLSEFDSWMQKH